MIIDGQDTTKITYATSYIITDAKTQEMILRFDTIEESNFNASSSTTSYPTEWGTMAMDYKYDNPDAFEAVGLIARRTENESDIDDIMKQLEFYKSGMYALNIQTKSGLKENYTLEGYEIVENIDNYSVLEVNMKFKEIPKFLKVNNRKSSDNDTVSAGVVQVRGQE